MFYFHTWISTVPRHEGHRFGGGGRAGCFFCLRAAGFFFSVIALAFFTIPPFFNVFVFFPAPPPPTLNGPVAAPCGGGGREGAPAVGPVGGSVDPRGASPLGRARGRRWDRRGIFPKLVWVGPARSSPVLRVPWTPDRWGWMSAQPLKRKVGVSTKGGVEAARSVCQKGWTNRDGGCVPRNPLIRRRCLDPPFGSRGGVRLSSWQAASILFAIPRGVSLLLHKVQPFFTLPFVPLTMALAAGHGALAEERLAWTSLRQQTRGRGCAIRGVYQSPALFEIMFRNQGFFGNIRVVL